MKSFLLNIFLSFLCFTGLYYPQDYYSGTNRFTVNIMPVFEAWSISGSTHFSEFSNIVSVGYYPSHNTSISLRSKYAAVGGDLNSLNGLSDSQISLRHSLSKYNLILTAGINIPSGKTKLSANQFETVRFISQDLFGMRTPNFGEGTNVILGASWIHQLSDNYVAGLGASYQIKTEYQPLSGFSDKYKPANEISVTGGLDIKLSDTQTLTGDIMSVFFGNDKVNGNEVFSSGNMTVFDAVYKQYFGFNGLSAILLYSIVSEKYYGSDIFTDNISSTLESLKLNPNKFYFGINFVQRFSVKYSLGYGIFTSIYEKTASFFSDYTVYGFNLNPDIKISSQLNIPVYLRYSRGSAPSKPDISSFSFGAGIGILF
ncbi:MAG: hypothetical protein WCE54_06845 [Ignavibacteriaceae bacterium]